MAVIYAKEKPFRIKVLFFCIILDFCVRAAWRDRRCDLCPQQPPPTGEHLSARDTRTSVPFGGFGTCGAVAESLSAAAWREMGPGQLAL